MEEPEFSGCDSAFAQPYNHQLSPERSAGGGGGDKSEEAKINHSSSQKDLKKFYSHISNEGMSHRLSDSVIKSVSTQQIKDSELSQINKNNHVDNIDPDVSRMMLTGPEKWGEPKNRREDKDEFAVTKPFNPVPIIHQNTTSAEKKNTGHSKMAYQASSNTQQYRKSVMTTGGASDDVPANKSVDLEYQFQRWNGDHSVKVLISTELSHETIIKLIPSGTRVADAISRHMDDMVPDVLMQQQSQDKRGRHQEEEVEE
ncbi:hypothetical protein EPIR_1704 [Erwinia piriflorinigrans CFBP 5888]|uniref:Surface presentation of antigen domain-containing protein n=1 Tax=Erwinia piriflorinigrans CFBP 5888 TaxID=1161919 RepID=V5Z7Z4_9GAMM|nr:hypothetical protein EPIR_1704 [Erwinia piriflorinigrans CFBP 5888]